MIRRVTIVIASSRGGFGLARSLKDASKVLPALGIAAGGER
jgi:hypoxanthine phosphoribosyltransferase